MSSVWPDRAIADQLLKEVRLPDPDPAAREFSSGRQVFDMRAARIGREGPFRQACPAINKLSGVIDPHAPHFAPQIQKSLCDETVTC